MGFQVKSWIGLISGHAAWPFLLFSCFLAFLLSFDSVSWFERGSFFVPSAETQRRRAQRQSRLAFRPPPVAARSGLDGREHGARLAGRGVARAAAADVRLDWAVSRGCSIAASPCIRSGKEAQNPNSSCTREGKAHKRRDPSEKAGRSGPWMRSVTRLSRSRQPSSLAADHRLGCSTAPLGTTPVSR